MGRLVKRGASWEETSPVGGSGTAISRLIKRNADDETEGDLSVLRLVKRGAIWKETSPAGGRRMSMSRLIKRNGDDEIEGDLSALRLVKRGGWKRESSVGGRRMALSRLIKRNGEHDLGKTPFNDYTIEEELPNVYPYSFLPTRVIKNEDEDNKYSALWKTRVG